MAWPLPTLPKTPADGAWGYYTGSGYWLPLHVNSSGYLFTEDTGEHSNPRKYEKDNGFYSAVVRNSGVTPTPLYTLTTNPARTLGWDTTIYTLTVENSFSGAVTAWLEASGAVILTPSYHMNSDETSVITFVAGHNVGDQDVYCNASICGVVFQIVGTEA